MVTAVQAAAAMVLYLSTAFLRALEQLILAEAAAEADSLLVAPSAAAVTAVQVSLLSARLQPLFQPQVRQQYQLLEVLQFTGLLLLARLHSKDVQWHILQK